MEQTKLSANTIVELVDEGDIIDKDISVAPFWVVRLEDGRS